MPHQRERRRERRVDDDDEEDADHHRARGRRADAARVAAGAHLGMRAQGDASSVGTATTRAVVVSIFLIIVVDAAFATVLTLMGHE